MTTTTKTKLTVLNSNVARGPFRYAIVKQVLGSVSVKPKKVSIVMFLMMSNMI
jgi:hypothetical protein